MSFLIRDFMIFQFFDRLQKVHDRFIAETVKSKISKIFKKPKNTGYFKIENDVETYNKI